MDALARARSIPLFAVAALALGGFAIGASEFTGMGLVSNLAQALLPTLYESEPARALAATAWVTTAYATGVVVGAPAIASLTARLPVRRVLIALLAMFVLGSVLSATSTTLPMLVGARFLAGLPHGAYFGIAVLAARRLLGEARRGLGAAAVIGGLTISNIVGIPVVTGLGQRFGWASAYIVISGLFAVALALVFVFVPALPADPRATVRSEIRALRRPQVWLALGMGAVGFGGLFAVYSFISPLSREITGLAPNLLPFLLATVGVGMTTGNFAAGWAADRSVRRTSYAALGLLSVGLICLALTARWHVGLFASAFLIGAGAAALGPTIQTRLMDVAHEGQTLVAALNHSAFNVANGLGAALGGIVIASGLGLLAPAWVGLILTAGGAVLAVTSFGLDRRHRRSGRVLPYGTGTISTITA